MALQQRSERGMLKEDPERSLVDAQLCGAEDGEETASHSSFSPWSSSSSPSSSPSSLTSSCSFLVVIPLEEGSAAGSLSPPQSSPQSPQSPCPSPADMAGAPGSQSDEEGSSTCGDSAVAQPWLQDALSVKVADLVFYLLLKYRSQQPTTQAEMLTVVSQDDQFPETFRQACEYLLLVLGVDVKEVDPDEHSYIPVAVLGLSCDDTPSGRQGLPKSGLLVLVLGVILLEDDHAPEEEVWKELGDIGVYAGEEHIHYGEPRELLTHVWVQEGYLEYRQVPGSEPARFEFLWGPRAHAETSGLQVLQHILMVNSRYLGASLSLCEEAGSHEQVWA